jgi:hypothetical protein
MTQMDRDAQHVRYLDCRRIRAEARLARSDLWRLAKLRSGCRSSESQRCCQGPVREAVKPGGMAQGSGDLAHLLAWGIPSLEVAVVAAMPNRWLAW